MLIKILKNKTEGLNKIKSLGQAWLCMSLIPATWKAETGRTAV
jgi:hypothetical protein